VSAFVESALGAAGLGDILAARAEGRAGNSLTERLAHADLLHLGALADRIRAAEVGDEVRIYTGRQPAAGSTNAPCVVVTLAEAGLTGFELLRLLATHRITGPRGVNIRVDWSSVGLELAQVALGFGANELCGVITSKRGLTIAPDELAGVGKQSRRESALLVKRRELGAIIEGAGRVPRFFDDAGAPEPSSHVEEGAA
jgi:hypothetical protein